MVVVLLAPCKNTFSLKLMVWNYFFQRLFKYVERKRNDAKKKTCSTRAETNRPSTLMTSTKIMRKKSSVENWIKCYWSWNFCLQIAYRRWLCAMMIPFRMGEYRIRPCRIFCTLVEQRCPYLTPDDKVIIAGEPMFFCKGILKFKQKFAAAKFQFQSQTYQWIAMYHISVNSSL